MKLKAKYLGLFLFVLLAALSLMILFGYRFDFESSRFTKFGVLYIGGQERAVTVSIGDTTRTVDLPYVMLDLPIGQQQVTLTKEGYLPIKSTVIGHELQAASIHTSFFPDLAELEALQVATSDRLQYLPTNTGSLVMIDLETKDVSYFHRREHIERTIPSHRYVLPRESFSSAYVNDQYLMVHSSAGTDLCPLSDDNCTFIPLQEGTSRPQDEQGYVVRLNTTTSSLELYDGAGRWKPFEETIVGEVTWAVPSEGMRIYVDDEDAGYRLETTFFGPRLTEVHEPVNSFRRMYDIDGSMFVYDTSSKLRRLTGEELLSNVDTTYMTSGGLVLRTDGGSIYVLRNDLPQFLTKVSEPLTGAYFDQRLNYFTLTLRHSIVQCHYVSSTCNEVSIGPDYAVSYYPEMPALVLTTPEFQHDYYLLP